MDFLEKLDFLMKRYELNKRSLSQKSEIPYTTIDNWYKRGYENLTLPTLRKLAKYFNTTLDYWFIDEITDPNYGKTSGFKVEYEEMEHIKNYRSLDDTGKERIDYELKKECERVKEIEELRNKMDTEFSSEIVPYPYLGKIACAGTGFYFDDIPIEIIKAPYSDGADFIIGVSGDSMEPDYHSGEKLYVKKVEYLGNGDVGIFTIGNECFLKELGEDGLISRNKDYDDIPGDEKVRLIGKVIGKVAE